MDEQWDRRQFLKNLGIGCAGIAGTSAVGFGARDEGREESVKLDRAGQVRDYRRPAEGDDTKLVIAKGDPASATRAALSALGGMKRFVSEGEKVVIKPNVGWDRIPIQAANTNPVVVSTLVKLCLEAGAAEVIVTDNTCNESRRAFTRSGIWKEVEAAGGKIVLPASHRFRPYELGGTVLGRMPVLVPAVRADRFINVPIAKHHGLSGFTGSMKNLYGVLGGRRNRLHQDINASIADLADFIRATLTVMDATRVLVRNGPQGGDVADTVAVGEIIASVDPVAVDTYGCGLIGLAPQDLPYLDLASGRGLGTSTLDRVKIEEVSG